MHLLDIYEFITCTYINKTPELLVLWLSNFNFYDRILFVRMFVIQNIILSWKFFRKFDINNKKYHVDGCLCQQEYDKIISDKFKEKSSTVWFLKKCIGKNVISDTYTNDVHFHYKSTFYFKMYDNYKLMFTHYQQKPKNNIFSIDTMNYAINDKDEKHQITLKWLELQPSRMKLNDIVDKINVYELYVLLYHFKMARVFDSLMPEYLKVESLRNRSRNLGCKRNAESILMNLYNFFDRKIICQTDTHMNMTNPLPTTKEFNEPIEDSLSEYFYQPKLSGIRLFICKTLKSQVFVMNKYTRKINLNCGEFLNLKKDTHNFYSGEFILLLYNIETESYRPRNELISYISTVNDPEYKKIYKLKLILVDLYMWNGINLLIDTYERRYKLFDNFVKFVSHQNMIVKIKNYNNTADLYDKYKQHLESTNINDSIVTGIVYRKKNSVYHTAIPIISFDLKFQRNLIIYKYKTMSKVLHINNNKEIINGCCCIIPANVYNYSINGVCYHINGNNLKIALYDKNKLKHFCSITTDTSNIKYKTLMKPHVKILNQLHKWIVVKIGFSDNCIRFLQFCPEKSLLDCSTFWFTPNNT
ncbi:hypothetical protein QKT26_gp35 [Carcinus maenas nudivirus]|uniref:Uncharacterized protein n=1 Tax=Carcinus maenas nudivirus TaxID=2880837 RepID=A0AAE8Y0F3_9VIRU|nr:hypothetical protein QKT26_gp35 [Carcinus maenas nudivirus]UBZ25625.1 hypothetical protein CmNV_035 [Carcinus maenas nudivirus]